MGSKIKVLHIIKSLGRGGAETLLPETLRKHDKEKFEWHYIYFLPWKNQMVEALESNQGLVTCFKASNNIQIMLRASEVIAYVRKHRIDIIHSHLPWAGILSRLIGRKTKIPVIYTEHNKQERYHTLTRWMNIATLNWATNIVAVSQDVAISVRKYKPRLTTPIATILNGVNEDFFSPGTFDGTEVRTSLGIPFNAPVIGTIAVFRFQKRLDVWLTLASKILEQIPQTHFIIVGDGPLKDQLLEKRAALRLEERVHFVGLKTEVRPFLAAFNIYMMTSVFEGLPIALLEAMASGCAVVSTDAGGVKEVIRHDVEGLLCDVNTPELLVPLAVSLLKSTERREKLTLQARKRILDHFSMTEMVKSLEKLYETVLPTRRSASG